MADKTILELPETNSLINTDLFVVQNGNNTKSIKYSDLKDRITNSIDLNALNTKCNTNTTNITTINGRLDDIDVDEIQKKLNAITASISVGIGSSDLPAGFGSSTSLCKEIYGTDGINNTLTSFNTRIGQNEFNITAISSTIGERQDGQEGRTIFQLLKSIEQGEISAATSEIIGGIKLGYEKSGDATHYKYPIELDEQHKAYAKFDKSDLGDVEAFSIKLNQLANLSTNYISSDRISIPAKNAQDIIDINSDINTINTEIDDLWNEINNLAQYDDTVEDDPKLSGGLVYDLSTNTSLSVKQLSNYSNDLALSTSQISDYTDNLTLSVSQISSVVKTIAGSSISMKSVTVSGETVSMEPGTTTKYSIALTGVTDYIPFVITTISREYIDSTILLENRWLEHTISQTTANIIVTNSGTTTKNVVLKCTVQCIKG